MTSRKTIVTGAALAVAVAVAGCSTAKSTSGGSAAGAPGPPSAVPSAAISGSQLTGTQLTATLLTSSDVPVAGFSAVTDTENDSGGSLTTANAKFTPATMSCGDLQNVLGEGGFGETAWSSNALVNGPSKEILSQTVYQFANVNAADAFFTTIKARTDSCGASTFTMSSQGSDAKLTLTITAAKSGVGQQDFANTMTGTENGAPTALATTVALDGPDVLMVGADKDGGTAVPTDINTGGLLAKLIRKVAAAR